MMGWQLAVRLRSGAKQEFDVGQNYGPGREVYAYVLSVLNT
jgi:hypothetical protein